MTGFDWWEHSLEFSDYAYNTTALNERAVELSIVRHWLRFEDRTLEVGNVLSHYGIGPERTVVDRYEVAPGVVNKDVFDISGEWDQIVSISTLEHVRWDEEPREPGRSVDAVLHLRGLLSARGRMLVTVPMGWNLPLDEWLLEGDTGCVRACTLIRDRGGWSQTERPVSKPYGRSTSWAESVWVGEWAGASG